MRQPGHSWPASRNCKLGARARDTRGARRRRRRRRIATATRRRSFSLDGQVARVPPAAGPLKIASVAYSPMSCDVSMYISLSGVFSALLTGDGGETCTGEPKATVPCIELHTSIARDATWQEAALKCMVHCQKGCYYGMWFESPCVKDTDFTNGAGAAKVFCPVPLLLLAIVLCLLGGLRSCFCNGATTSPPQNQQETLGRDSTAETATLAGRSMKDASDSSYP